MFVQTVSHKYSLSKNISQWKKDHNLNTPNIRPFQTQRAQLHPSNNPVTINHHGITKLLSSPVSVCGPLTQQMFSCRKSVIQNNPQIMLNNKNKRISENSNYTVGGNRYFNEAFEKQRISQLKSTQRSVTPVFLRKQQKQIQQCLTPKNNLVASCHPYQHKDSENKIIDLKKNNQRQEKSVQQFRQKVKSYIKEAHQTDIKSRSSKKNNLNSTKEGSSQEVSPRKRSNTVLAPTDNSISILQNISKPKKVGLSDFKLLRKIGQGKYGQLFSMIHKNTGLVFAIKKLRKEQIKRQNMIERVILEIKLQSYIQHPNIVKLYGVFDDKESIYMILQLMEEGSLFEMMMKRNYHKKSVNVFNEKIISRILYESISGINYLHSKNIIHRDIKPENIVSSYGVAKLCDLGWSALTNNNSQRRSTSCGTFDYIAPEILKGQEYGNSVDMWEIGVLAYQLCVGQLPFYYLSRKQTYQAIINYRDKLHFPKPISSDAQNFIQCLLRGKSQNRVSSDQILLHRFALLHSQEEQ